MKRIELSFVCAQLNLSEDRVLRWVDCELIQPADRSGPLFDEEDLTRLKLIDEIQELYATNEDSLKIILHLVDQIHHLTAELKKLKANP